MSKIYVEISTKIEDLIRNIRHEWDDEIEFNQGTDNLFIQCLDALKLSKKINKIIFNCDFGDSYIKLFDLITNNPFIENLTIERKLNETLFNKLLEKLKINYNLTNIATANNYTNNAISEIVERNKVLNKLLSFFYNKNLLLIDDISLKYSEDIVLFFLKNEKKVDKIKFIKCDTTQNYHIVYLIKRLIYLNSIDISESNLTETFFQELFKSLPQDNIEKINLFFNKNKFNDEPIYELLKFLDSHQNYSINFSYFDSKKFKLLIEHIDYSPSSLVKNYRISDKSSFKLIYHDNEIIIDFVLDVAFYLIKEGVIREVDFSNTRMPKDIFKDFINNCVKHNATLVKLKLICCADYDNGIKELAKILNDNTCNLLCLDLRSLEYSFDYNSYGYHHQYYYMEQIKNGLTNEAVISLLEALEKNKKLINLNLSGSNINGTIVNQLVATIKKNTTLTHLILEHTFIEEEQAKNLFKEITKGKQANKSLVHLNVCKHVTFVQKSKTYAPIYKYKPSTLKIVENLIATNSGNKTALVNAVEGGNKDKINSLIKNASIYSANKDGVYLIFIAIEKGHFDVVKYLISQCDYNLQIVNTNNQTPLEYAFSLNQQDKENNIIDDIIEFLTNPYINSRNNNFLDKQSKNKRKFSAISPPLMSNQNNGLLDNDRATLAPPTKKIKLNQAATVSSNSDKDNYDDFDVELNDLMDKVLADNTEDGQVNDSASQVSIQSNNTNENFLTKKFNKVSNLIVTNNIYQLKYYLARNQIQDLANVFDKNGNTLLQLAIELNNLQIVNILLNHNLDFYLSDAQDTDILDFTINLLQNNTQPTFEKKVCYQIIYTLIKAGATVSIDKINHAIQLADYRLFKILLNSDCDINAKDHLLKTPLIYTIDTRNEVILDRLLIYRNLNFDTINEALSYVKNLQLTNHAINGFDSSLFKIACMLEKRCHLQIPENKPGLQWIKQFQLFYGSPPTKPTKILKLNSDKQLAYLAQQNSYSKVLMQHNFDEEETNKVLDNLGNPVTASLVFIVSNKVHMPLKVSKRDKIRVNLNFHETHHLTNNDSENSSLEVKNKIIQRIKYTKQEIFETVNSNHKYNALTEEDIENKFQAKSDNHDPGFVQLLHHGEQSLLDFLEEKNNLQLVINKLRQNPKFVKGCKIYAVILELYSPRYVCENCELAILSVQDEKKSLFIKNLKNLLVTQGCVLPTFSPLRVITLVSSQIAYNSDVISEEEHNDYFVDIRSCNNNLILVKDNSVFERSSLTQFHSNRLNHN